MEEAKLVLIFQFRKGITISSKGTLGAGRGSGCWCHRETRFKPKAPPRGGVGASVSEPRFRQFQVWKFLQTSRAVRTSANLPLLEGRFSSEGHSHLSFGRARRGPPGRKGRDGRSLIRVHFHFTSPRPRTLPSESPAVKDSEAESRWGGRVRVRARDDKDKLCRSPPRGSSFTSFQRPRSAPRLPAPQSWGLGPPELEIFQPLEKGSAHYLVPVKPEVGFHRGSRLARRTAKSERVLGWAQASRGCRKPPRQQPWLMRPFEPPDAGALPFRRAPPPPSPPKPLPSGSPKRC